MTASEATTGYGDTLEYSNDGGTTWVEVAGLTSCDLPSHTVEKADRTHLKSPDRTKEYAPGMRDVTDVSFGFQLSDTIYSGLYAHELALDVLVWRHTLAVAEGQTTGAQYQYKGWIELGGGSRESGSVTEVTGTIKRTGSATFTAGT